MPSLPASRSYTDFPIQAQKEMIRDRDSFQEQHDIEFEKIEDQGFVIHDSSHSFSNIEEVEENLSLEQKTKELIQKALKTTRLKKRVLQIPSSALRSFPGGCAASVSLDN